MIPKDIGESEYFRAGLYIRFLYPKKNVNFTFVVFTKKKQISKTLCLRKYSEIKKK